tara:strand:- start:1838 stop:4264 length:2427 start_codon:yes stop_codon:yes gene_type:complete
MSELYNLIFFPTIKPGEDETEVKIQLALKLKIDAAKVDSWFASGKPTLLLKEVASDVADRYMQAILACGGNCNMQPSGSDGKGSLSLVPKPTNVELFFCPACEHEEELAPGETYEQCPKCDLVMAKWAERQEEERKKAEIRRRLLRDARFKDDASSDEQRKKDELAELKRLEAEIMKELGIKPPGKLWQVFSARPVSISASIGILLITLSSAISFFVSDYIDSAKQAEIASGPASEEIQMMAPAIADAVGLQLSGNQAVVDELAAVTQLLGGQQINAAVLTKATEQMMKGASNEQFMQQANAGPDLKVTTPGGLGEPAPVAVNRDTLGGVKGLPGIDQISDEQLGEIRRGEVIHGQEQVLDVLSHKIQIPDSKNPNGPDILVDQIDKLDGSKVVGLMKSLSRDLEWDAYLLSHVRDFLFEGQMGQAGELDQVIKNPSLKIEGLIWEIEHLVGKDPDADLKLMMARLSNEMSHIESLDLRAKFWLRLGVSLELAGVPDQPYGIFTRVESIADDAEDPGDRAAVIARLAVAHLGTINVSRARILFNQAMKEAGSITSVGARISAFSSIAQRYYDARNLTLAGEIIAEAQILAATELKTQERTPAFFDIAAAQLYMGDMAGALQSVRNSASGSARQKLIVELAAWSIDQGEIYQGQALMAQIDSSAARYRLAIRLVSRVAHDGNERKAIALISEFSPRPEEIEDPSERALILSQFARLHLRLRQPDRAEQMFSEALAISDQMAGRKAAVTRGMVALDQARGLWIGKAKATMDKVSETIVSEPIGSEITATERVINNLLPQSVRDKLISQSK